MMNDGTRAGREAGRYGLVGLGLMGSAMARRLLAAGHQVVAYDTSPERLKAFVDAGGEAAGSAREVADAAEVVVASVSDAAASRVVCLSQTGVLHGNRVRIYLETSTIGIVAARELAAALGERSISFIDAPVSGGPRAIDACRLTAIVAGPQQERDISRGVLDNFCSNVFVVGDQAGLAQACKLVNNAISLSILALASEAIVAGVKAGLDARSLVEVINASSGRSGVTMDKFPTSILNRRFDFGGAMATASKDLALFVDEARALGATLEGTPVLSRVWRDATASGNPQRDFTEIVKWYEAPAGVVVGKPEPH